MTTRCRSMLLLLATPILSAASAQGQLSLLRSFAGENDLACPFCFGASPYGSLTLDGNLLYGMTSDGGANGYGTHPRCVRGEG